MALLKPRAEHGFILIGQRLDHLIRSATLRRHHTMRGVVEILDLAEADIFARGRMVAHKILKDPTDAPPQIFQIVLTQVDPVKQDLALSRIVHNGCFGCSGSSVSIAALLR